MKTITRYTQIFMFLLAAASSPHTLAADTDVVVWSFGSGVNLFYPQTPTPIGVVTGTFTYALGGGPIDWNIQTPALPLIVNFFFGKPAVALTPANSSLSGSTSTVFRVSIPSADTFTFEVDLSSSGVTFNQPGSTLAVVAEHYASGPTALSSNGFGSGSPTIFGVVAAIPEPQTYAMLGLGLGVLVLVRRRTTTS